MKSCRGIDIRRAQCNRFSACSSLISYHKNPIGSPVGKSSLKFQRTFFFARILKKRAGLNLCNSHDKRLREVAMYIKKNKNNAISLLTEGFF